MQAVLILAHKNVKQVYELSKLLNEQFYVYIHFDAKYEIPQSFIEMLSQLRNVFVIKRINVNWGVIQLLWQLRIYLKKLCLMIKLITFM